MDYKVIPFEQRIKENIRSYALDNLYTLDVLTEYCKAFCAAADVAILITERHGEKIVSVGGFAGFTPDVVGEPGRKVRVYGRTIAHLYAETGKVPEERRAAVERMLDSFAAMLSHWGRKLTFIRRRRSMWMSWNRSWACSMCRQPEEKMMMR